MRKSWMIAPLAVVALAGAAAARDARPGVSCINDSTVESPRPQKDGTLYFRGVPNRNRSFIGTFKGGGCPGMRIWSTLIIKRDGGQYCEGDLVRAVEPPQTIPGAVCMLDRFYPAPPEPARAPRR